MWMLVTSFCCRGPLYYPSFQIFFFSLLFLSDFSLLSSRLLVHLFLYHRICYWFSLVYFLFQLLHSSTVVGTLVLLNSLSGKLLISIHWYIFSAVLYYILLIWNIFLCLFIFFDFLCLLLWIRQNSYLSQKYMSLERVVLCGCVP